MQGHLLGLLRDAALVHHVGHGEEVCLVGLEEFFGEAQLGDAVAAGQQGDRRGTRNRRHRYFRWLGRGRGS